MPSTVFPNRLVRICTGGRPVILDSSFSQHVFWVETNVKSSKVIAEPGCLPNIPPVPVICSIQLGPSFVRDAPMHPGEGLARCLLQHTPVATTAPFSEFQYTDRYQTYLDEAKFSRIWNDGTELEWMELINEHADDLTIKPCFDSLVMSLRFDDI